MNYKSFVFALGLLIVGSSCIYAQNKAKNVTKAVEAAVTKKVPSTAAKAGAAGTAAVAGASALKSRIRTVASAGR